MKSILILIVFFLITIVGFSQTYTFTGNGNWSIASNWYNNTVPPDTLPAGDTIYISPMPNDSCVLNVHQIISEEASLIVTANTRFVIQGDLNINIFRPTITTTSISNITACGATGGGNITNDGHMPIISKGLVWSTSPNPTIELSTKSMDGTGIGVFESNINLQLSSFSTTYYVRAYATNAVGTSYGNELSFTTPSIHNYVSSAVTSTGNDSATFTGSYNIDPCAIIAKAGISWSSNPNDILNSGTKVYSSDVSNGYFSAIITGLSPATTYYARPFLEIMENNSTSVSYYFGGPVIMFKTLSNLPVVSTDSISFIMHNSAVMSGTVINDGGSVITARGAIWGTDMYDPTIYLNTRTTDGTGTGSYTSNITGLESNTIYYVIAYATNKYGTSYGRMFLIQTSDPE